MNRYVCIQYAHFCKNTALDFGIILLQKGYNTEYEKNK